MYNRERRTEPPVSFTTSTQPMTEALTSGLLHDAQALYEKLSPKMSDALATRFLQFLARLDSVQKNGAGGAEHQKIDALGADLAAVLIGISEERLWESAPTVNGDVKGFSDVTPEIRAWAAQQFSDEELLAGLREIEETGGLEFHEFVHELEPRQS